MNTVTDSSKSFCIAQAGFMNLFDRVKALGLKSDIKIESGWWVMKVTGATVECHRCAAPTLGDLVVSLNKFITELESVPTLTDIVH